MGNMIGSGIYLLPSTLAPLGWNSVLGWILTIAGGLCLAATFAWLAKQIPVNGGPYAYTEKAFGPLAAFMVTWSYWISLWIGTCAIAIATISYLGVFVPGLADYPGGQAGAAIVLIWLLSLLNLKGIRSAGGFQLVTTIIKVVPLLLIIALATMALGSGEAQLGAESADVPINTGALTAAATLTLWAVLGLESATIPAGRIHDPERTVPFATMVGTALTGLLYLLVCSSIILLMPAETIAGSGAPFVDYVTRYWGAGPALMIGGFALVSCVGAVNGWILVQSELPFVMARHGHFPRWIGVQNQAGAPGRSMVFSGILMTAVLMLNAGGSAAQIFEYLLLISTCCTLFMYLACMAGALRLNFSMGRSMGRGLFWIAGLATLFSAWTIYGAGGEAVAWGVGLLAVSVPIYFFLAPRSVAVRN